MTIETESSGETAGNQAVRQVSGPSRRPSGTSLGVPQAEANVVSHIFWGAPRAKKSVGATRQGYGCVNFKGPSQGLGPAPRGCSGLGLQGWAGAFRDLGCRLAGPGSEKSPGRGLAKG